MSDETAGSEQEIIQRTAEIRDGYIRPNLQHALQEAINAGHDRNETLNAMMAGYQDMLINVVGPQSAAQVLEHQAQFIRDRVIPAMQAQQGQGTDDEGSGSANDA